MLKADEKKNQYKNTILLIKAPTKKSKRITRAGVLVVIPFEERVFRCRNLG